MFEKIGQSFGLKGRSDVLFCRALVAGGWWRCVGAHEDSLDTGCGDLPFKTLLACGAAMRCELIEPSFFASLARECTRRRLSLCPIAGFVAR